MALFADLGSLTPAQRNALMAALSSRGSAGDVAALIEAEFAKAPACGHCRCEAFSRWGVATGMKRYMCNACERTFNALTGTPLAHLQKRGKWLEYARAIVDGLSLRKAAKRVGMHLETSFRWLTASWRPPRARRQLLSPASLKRTRPSSANRRRGPGGWLAAPRESADAIPRGALHRGARLRPDHTHRAVPPPTRCSPICRLARSLPTSHQSLPRMRFSSAMDATPTAPLRTPRTSCTSRSSPAAASTPTRLPHSERQRLH